MQEKRWKYENIINIKFHIFTDFSSTIISKGKGGAKKKLADFL
jgi:hypothetical protein